MRRAWRYPAPGTHTAEAPPKDTRNTVSPLPHVYEYTAAQTAVHSSQYNRTTSSCIPQWRCVGYAVSSFGSLGPATI